MIITTENTKAVTNDNDLATLVKGDVIKVGCPFSDETTPYKTTPHIMVYGGLEEREEKSWFGLKTTKTPVHVFLGRTAAVNVPLVDRVIQVIDLDVEKKKHYYHDGALYVLLSETTVCLPRMSLYHDLSIKLESAGL